MLIPILGVLSKDEVKQFRSHLDQAEWQDGLKTAGTLARAVKRNLQLEDGSPLAVELGNHILRKLGSNPLFISAALPSRIYPPKFNRYQDGGTYGAHVDSAVMQVPGTHVSVRSDLSATLFLAEPEEYDGGELQVEGPFGIQAVKLAAGDMVLYPSSSLHQVNPVTRGARVASFFWIQSMVRSDMQRRLLFELDTSIETLRRSNADAQAVLQLTGVYHNLLRGWAET